MHTQRAAAKRAFTLIEILIVVVILGILAAIVIPQFTSAADDANESSARSQLQTARAQIELYRFKHSEYPMVNEMLDWDKLIEGNYLHSAPGNPLRNNSTTVAGSAEGDDVGWVWEYNSQKNLGRLYIVDAEGNLKKDW